MRDNDEKVAVGEAVVAGYRFGFGRVGAVAGAAWLPFLVLIGLSTAATLLSSHLTTALTAKAPSGAAAVALNGSYVLIPLRWLIQSVFEGIAAAGVMSIALNRHKPGFVYFSFGPVALRMIAAFVVVNVIVIALCAALLAVFIGAAYAMGEPLPPPGSPLISWLSFPLRNFMMCSIAPSLCPSSLVLVVLVVLGLVEFALLIYVMVRLTFFLPAVVVSEQRIGIARSWTLAGGNFWRVFAAWLGVAIPVAIVAALAQYFVAKLMLPNPLAGGAPRSTSAIALALQGMPLLLIVTSALTLIERVVTLGLESGAQAHAYNKLTMADAPDVF